MSDHEEADTVDSVRSTLGAELRAARERKNLSAEEAASRLMLGVNVIRGLESGDYQGLPELAYIRGYMLSYLRLLGLPHALLDDFDNANRDQYPIKLNLSSARPSCSRDGWARCISIGLLVLLALAIGLWFAEEAIQFLESGELSFEQKTEQKVQQVVVNEPSYETPAEMLTPAEGERQEAEIIPATDAKIGEPPDPEQALSVQSGQDSSVVQADIYVRLSGDSWVEILNAAGKRLAKGNFTEGQEIKLNDDNPPFLVVLGDAGQVYMEYQGERIGKSWKRGQVVRMSLGESRP